MNFEKNCSLRSLVFPIGWLRTWGNWTPVAKIIFTGRLLCQTYSSDRKNRWWGCRGSGRRGDIVAYLEQIEVLLQEVIDRHLSESTVHASSIDQNSECDQSERGLDLNYVNESRGRWTRTYWTRRWNLHDWMCLLGRYTNKIRIGWERWRTALLMSCNDRWKDQWISGIDLEGREERMRTHWCSVPTNTRMSNVANNRSMDL